MGKLSYIKGDLFDTKRQMIIHGCNNSGVFGKGIAYQIAKLFPLARYSYIEKFNNDGFNLGDVQFVPTKKGLVIANLITQDTYGNTGIHVNYDACSKAFKEVIRYAEKNQFGVAMPKIGAGLGGGDWKLVEEKLLKELEDHDVEVDVHYL